MPWIVKLTQQPTSNDFRSGFFPRLVWYRKEAQELVDEIRRKGGDAALKEVTRQGVPKSRSINKRKRQ